MRGVRAGWPLGRLAQGRPGWPLGRLAQGRPDVDRAFVLDRHEGRADPHDHRLGVREQLVRNLLGVPVHGHLDPDLVDRARVEPGFAQLLQQPVVNPESDLALQESCHKFASSAHHSARSDSCRHSLVTRANGREPRHVALQDLTPGFALPRE